MGAMAPPASPATLPQTVSLAMAHSDRPLHVFTTHGKDRLVMGRLQVLQQKINDCPQPTRDRHFLLQQEEDAKMGYIFTSRRKMSAERWYKRVSPVDLEFLVKI